MFKSIMFRFRVVIRIICRNIILIENENFETRWNYDTENIILTTIKKTCNNFGGIAVY